LPGDRHGGFGERPGETDREQSPHRAPGRLNHWSVRAADETLARRMLDEVRRVPELDAAMPPTDDIVARGYVDLTLATIAEAPQGVEAVLRAIDLAAET